jgi:hypothetical protein
MEMTEREQFEEWMKRRSGYPFAAQFANLMWEAWQAARATPADHSLPVAWKDAYAAFKGAFDTPQMRMKMNDDYSQDARKRLRNFDELMNHPPQNAADHIEAQSVAVAWLIRWPNGNEEVFMDLEVAKQQAAMFRTKPVPLCPQSEAQSVRDAWISVDERLPEEGTSVLAAHGLGIADVMYQIFNDHGKACWRDCYGDSASPPTHWQPLPPPPQKPVSDEVKP